MRNSKEAVSIRVDAKTYKYLKLSALSMGNSITKNLSSILEYWKKEMDRHSMIEITRCRYDDCELYSAHFGVCDIYEGPSLKDAKAAIAKWRKEHGFDARRIKLAPEIEVEDFRRPPIALPNVSNVVAL